MKLKYPHSHTKIELYEIFDSYFDSITERKMEQGVIENAEKSWNDTKDVMDVTIYAMGSCRNAQLTIPRLKREIIKTLEELL